MDKSVEILLGSQKNINSVNVNTYDKIELTREVSELTEFDVNDVVNSTEQFDAEREANPVYRIYGRIEYLSLLNGIKAGHNTLEEFFNPVYTGSTMNLLDDYDFYLVVPASGVSYSTIPSSNLRKRVFQVIAGKEDFEIYNAGFTNNVYGEQTYAFSFKSDFDVSHLFDSLGFPVMELFLYAQYKIQSVIVEQMSYTTWTTSAQTKTTFNKKDFVIGDIVETNSGADVYDLIEYDANEFYQAQAQTQTYYIRTRYSDSGHKWLEWSYNPFIPLRLRYFESTLSTAKASQVIENTTLLTVSPVSNPTLSNTFTGTKTFKQVLTPSINTLEDWDGSSTSYYYWDDGDGILEFDNTGTYNVEFKTQIYLPEGTDKYIAESYLQVNSTPLTGGTIDTRRKYLSNDAPIQTVKFTRAFNSSDELKVRVRLIPNPERKIEIIPDYAAIRSDGRLIWREILPQGYTEPLTNIGVDYPFFNGKRYLFEPIVFDVVPNLRTETALKHDNTLLVFNEIEYWQNATNIDITPANNNINEFGLPCQ